MSGDWAHFEDGAEAKGYAQISNALLRSPHISLQAKGFYALLKSYAWQDPTSFPGVKRLREDTGASDNTLKKYRDELIRAGLLEVKRRGRGKTNLYVFKSIAKFLESHTGAKQESHTGDDLESHTGANNEDSVEEDSVNNSRRDAGASKKPNYFKDFCDDMAKVGLTVDDDHRKTIPKNLTYLLEKKDATPSEMVQVVWKMVEARARTERPYELSPQKALDQVRGVKPALSLVQPEPTSVSPDSVINAVQSYNRDGITDLQDFAPLARKWDFTLAEKPPWEIFRELGGNDEERWRNLKRIQSVSSRAVRSVG